MSKKWLKRSGFLGLIVTVLAALTVAIAGFHAPAQAAGPQLRHVGLLTPRFTTLSLDSAASGNSGGATIPTWSSTFSYKGTTYKYTMVGTNPADGSATTSVPTEIIPIQLNFSNGISFDGSKKVGPTNASPLFRYADFTSGNTQYGDAFQRSEFWKYVSTTSKQYHVYIHNTATYPTVILNVPKDKGQVAVTTTGVTIGLADYTWWVNRIQILLNQLNIQPNTLPIFLTYNILLYTGGNPNNCCVFGFHGSTTTTIASHQTFAWSSWTDPGIFSVPIEDINGLSHEIGEWLNDPFIHNVVPDWSSPIAPQYGCNNALEVGDPLVGVTFTVNGYHPQDLADFSWFAHKVPSWSQNGNYSYLGTFTKPATVC